MSAAAIRPARVRAMRPAPLLVLPLLAGCFSGFTSNQLPEQTYVLALQPAQAPAASGEPTQGGPSTSSATPTTGSVEVLLPIGDAGLGGDSIAVERAGERLDYYNGARWAAPVPAMLQTLVIQTLRRQGRFALVESDSGPFEATYLLSVELTHFEADYAVGSAGTLPTVHVELVCTLGGRIDRHVIQSFTATSTVMADADRMQAVIAAFERATNDALGQLAAHIAPPAHSAPAQPAE